MPTTRLAWFVVLAACLLWVTVDLQPLFYSNQNTKFLHGLAQAGLGQLREDWMANTVDGLPVFTLIVRWTAEIGPFWLFYLEQFLVYFVYILAAFLIFRRAGSSALSQPLPLLLFACIFPILHYESAMVGGVANQLMVKSIYEPATFGAFAILAIAAFLAGRWLFAALLINLAAAVHPGYVAPGGFLLLGMVACLSLVDRPQRARLVFAVVLGLALLGLNAYLLKLAFPPTSPELQAEATDLLANKRIPQHSDPLRWLNLPTVLKLGLCLFAAVVTPNRWIARLLYVGVAAILLSAILVLVVEANLVRLVSPWRVSVFLLPLAWIAALAWLTERLLPWLAQRPHRPRRAVAVAALLAVAVGGWGMAENIHNFSRRQPSYIGIVQAALAPGQLYLTSPRLTDFRLDTGAPQYISRKSHPYLDVEVLEWSRRMEVATALYESDSFDCAELQRLRDKERVTHVLASKDGPAMDCPFATEIAAERSFKLFRLDGAGPS